MSASLRRGYDGRGKLSVSMIERIVSGVKPYDSAVHFSDLDLNEVGIQDYAVLHRSEVYIALAVH